MSKKRPESTLPPELFYYSFLFFSSSHIIEVQTKITERALELLALPEDEYCLVLDIGCGSGLSGETISDNGHKWIGIDISLPMLSVAKEREVEGDLVHGDIGVGLPFRSASFDGAISVSAIQWLCNSNRTDHNPVGRIRSFFSSLYACLTRTARAVLQFYPESAAQADLLQSEAMRAGFTGGLIIDYPNSTRAKKYFLVLDVSISRDRPQPLTDDGPIPTRVLQGRLEEVRKSRQLKRVPKHSVAWIKQKKERARKQMKEVANDSKYTGRKRSNRF
ncbi:unnamed protein product [Dicrocoelium dendriticum]|nr:unnamed protein product [Dicrocoelium dendriticum]